MATVQVAPQQDFDQFDAIVDKTCFLLLSFHRFGNSKKVRNLSLNTQADESRFKHNKKLLELPELAAIVKADNAIRLLVDAYCIPYMEGTRICPWKNVPKVRELVKAYITVERPTLVDCAAEAYDGGVKQAEVDLKEHFNPLDYPTKEDFKKAYSASFQVRSFSTPDKLQKIDPMFFEEEEQKAKQMYQSAVSEFVSNLRVTAFDMVAELLDKLSDNDDGKKKRLRPERLQAIKDFIAGFDALNVASDSTLQGELKKLNALVDGVDVEQIRENEGFKLEFTQKVKELKSSMGKLVEVKGRKFRD